MKDAKAKWLAKGPRCYRLTIRTDTGDPLSGKHLRVVVCDGRITSATDLRANPVSQLKPSDLQLGSVDGIFEEMESALARQPLGSVRASYNSALGYPIRADVYHDKFGYDAGAAIDVESLEPLDCATSDACTTSTEATDKR
jgi:hypothetical protein